MPWNFRTNKRILAVCSFQVHDDSGDDGGDDVGDDGGGEGGEGGGDGGGGGGDGGGDDGDGGGECKHHLHIRIWRLGDIQESKMTVHLNDSLDATKSLLQLLGK